MSINTKTSVLAHPTGNANVRATLGVLQDNTARLRFVTTLGFSRQMPPPRLLPQKLEQIIRRRRYDSGGYDMKRFPLMELRRLCGIMWPAGSAGVDRLYMEFDHKLSNWLTKNPADILYGYEDGCAESFQVNRSAGGRNVYELPIGYWREARRIQDEEAERQPEWAGTMPAINEPEWKLERKDAEIGQADIVIVASRFTARTLDSFPGKVARIERIPYGFDFDCVPELRKPGVTGERKLRVLFVGSLTQRKGLSYLLEAAEKVASGISLTLIGRKVGKCEVRDRLLKQHRWLPSVSRQEIFSEMSEHDVLVLPSIFEGYGLVLWEAMAAGMTVITTSHTAGPDIMEFHPDAGKIVPIRDADAIASELESLVNDRDKLRYMSEQALLAAGASTIDKYENNLLCALRTIF